jgi:CubicO group peptidase (beta-lactamase class C family)
VDRSAKMIADLRSARRLFEPGTGFSYSNAGFSVVAAVVEAVSGEPFEAFVRGRFLRPLGMTTACFRADDAITHRVAALHLVVGGKAVVVRGAGWQPGWELGRVDWGAGGLIASLAHLLAWCRFQLSGAAADGTRVLSAESLARVSGL